MGEPGPTHEGIDNSSFLGWLLQAGPDLRLRGSPALDGSTPTRWTTTGSRSLSSWTMMLRPTSRRRLDSLGHERADPRRPDPRPRHLAHRHPRRWLGGVHHLGSRASCHPRIPPQNITDAWAILDEDDAKRTGVHWAALQAELQAIHGTVSPLEPPEPSPVVTPPPTPPSPPEPVPSPSAGILRQVIEDIEKAFDDILNKLEELI